MLLRLLAYLLLRWYLLDRVILRVPFAIIEYLNISCLYLVEFRSVLVLREWISLRHGNRLRRVIWGGCLDRWWAMKKPVVETSLWFSKSQSFEQIHFILSSKLLLLVLLEHRKWVVICVGLLLVLPQGPKLVCRRGRLVWLFLLFPTSGITHSHSSSWLHCFVVRTIHLPWSRGGHHRRVLEVTALSSWHLAQTCAIQLLLSMFCFSFVACQHLVRHQRPPQHQ